MKNSFYPLFLAFLAFPILLSAQEITRYRKLATQEVHQRLMQENPEFSGKIADLEKKVKDFKPNLEKNKKIRLPIIFHVLYKQGEVYPNTDQIISQLEALNQDFDRDKEIHQKADTLEKFVEKVAKIEIQFCLPKIKNKHSEEVVGYQFVPTDTSEWKALDHMKSAATGGVDAWDTQKYINVWVVNLADGYSGYAQMPGGPELTDGIVIDYDFFGTEGTAIEHYRKGRTLTHLMGSYLGLRELWSEDMYCADDFVSDTPIHNAPNHRPSPYQHLSGCDGSPVEMTMNFMDNGIDEKMYMFTLGQKWRMYAFLQEDAPRYLLQQTDIDCSTKNLKGVDPITVDSGTDPDSWKFSDVSIKLFPNPTRNLINLEFITKANTTANIVIYDALGRIHYQTEQFFDYELKLALNCQTWTTGIYFVKINANGEIYQANFIKASK